MIIQKNILNQYNSTSRHIEPALGPERLPLDNEFHNISRGLHWHRNYAFRFSQMYIRVQKNTFQRMNTFVLTDHISSPYRAFTSDPGAMIFTILVEGFMDNITNNFFSFFSLRVR